MAFFLFGIFKTLCKKITQKLWYNRPRDSMDRQSVGVSIHFLEK